MASEVQIFSREMILSAYKAVLHLSRTLYKSTLFMQNKANFRNGQMNISSFITSKYENLDIWWIGKNKANSKPIKANQSQFAGSFQDAQNEHNLSNNSELYQ